MTNIEDFSKNLSYLIDKYGADAQDNILEDIVYLTTEGLMEESYSIEHKHKIREVQLYIMRAFVNRGNKEFLSKIHMARFSLGDIK